jgi:16S rRNA (uracil1498-N3)-methyltransferase
VVPRFFAPTASTTGSIVELPEDEAAHLVRVLRIRNGATVRAFNGRGQEWRAAVHEIGRRRVSLELVEDVKAAPEPGVRIVLSVSLLKGDKMDEVVRDAVMLGASAIRPVLSRRVDGPGTRTVGEARRTRWQRIAVSSAKQCGRAVVPDVLPASTLSELLKDRSGRRRLALMEPESATGARRIADVPRSDEVELVVGPEGGWAADEGEQLAATCQLVTMGSQTLRADAVPLIAITALRVAWDDF